MLCFVSNLKNGMTSRSSFRRALYMCHCCSDVHDLSCKEAWMTSSQFAALMRGVILQENLSHDRACAESVQAVAPNGSSWHTLAWMPCAPHPLTHLIQRNQMTSHSLVVASCGALWHLRSQMLQGSEKILIHPASHVGTSAKILPSASRDTLCLKRRQRMWRWPEGMLSPPPLHWHNARWIQNWIPGVKKLVCLE